MLDRVCPNNYDGFNDISMTLNKIQIEVFSCFRIVRLNPQQLEL